MLYGAYRVGLYPTVRDSVGRLSGNRNNDTQTTHSSLIRQRLLSGMVTGGLGSMVSCPLDVVRTRMQADAGLVFAKSTTCQNPAIPPYYYATGLRQGHPVQYTGMLSALITIWREEGLARGLYRGASVTIARAGCLNGAQLASYDTMKQYAGREDKSNNSSLLLREGPHLHIVCAFLSGVLAQTVIMPIDTVKNHMMLGRGWKDVLQHVGMLVSRSVYPFRLMKWMYRGYVPACANQGLIMVLQKLLLRHDQPE